MDILFELLFELIVEILIQVLLEIPVELGLSYLAEKRKRAEPVHPVLGVIGYGLLGSIGGLISYLVFPNSFLVTQSTRILNLILAPLVVGLAFVKLGDWREDRGKPQLLIHRFSYGYFFALVFAVVRLLLVS